MGAVLRVPAGGYAGAVGMIDWSRICLDLRRICGSMRGVARLVKEQRGDYLSKLMRGEIEEPRYSLGQALIEAYRAHYGIDVPMLGR